MLLNISDVPQWNRLATDECDADFIEEYTNRISDSTIKDADMLNAQDEYVNMEVGIPRGPDGELENAKVKRRALDVDDMPIGRVSNNPVLDTRAYEVQYSDCTVRILPANLIAECILSQVDEEGHKEMLFEEIIDNRSNQATIKCSDGKTQYKTTKGWDLCVQWKGGRPLGSPLKT